MKPIPNSKEYRDMDQTDRDYEHLLVLSRIASALEDGLLAGSSEPPYTIQPLEKIAITLMEG